MINILVPTDFSDLSKVSVLYAIKFANTMNANITLLHVVNIVQPSRASMRLRLQALEQEFLETAKEDFDALVNEVTGYVKTSHTIKTKIVQGASFSEMVKKEAKRLRTGLIIMGSRGASGLKKYVMGSNTASVIEVSHVPVLVVPELAQFKAFRNVVYATDMTHTEKELKKLIPYLEKFDATVHLIHVTTSLKEVFILEKKIEGIVAKTGFKKVIVKVMVNKNIDEAINHYVTSTKADLITMFTHEHGFYAKLFNRSLTRKIAFQSKIPLLAFKQR